MLFANLKTCTRLSTKYFTSSSYVKVVKFETILSKSSLAFFPPAARNFITLSRPNSNLRLKLLWTIKPNATISKVNQSGSSSNIITKKVKLRRKDVSRLFSLAKSEKLTLTAAMGFLVISSTITMCVPYALGKILDIIFNKSESIEKTKQQLTNFCLILCGVFLVGAITNFGRVYLFNSSSLRIVQNLRAKLYRAMLVQETSWFDTKGTGELINRLSTDTYLVGNSLSQNLSDGLRSTVMILAGTSMMIYTSPQLALVSTCVVPGIAGLAILYGRYLRNITQSLLDKYADISKSVEERLGNIKTVKIFCKEEQESLAYLDKLTDALQLGYKEVLAKATFFGLTGFSGNVIIMSVLFYGGTLVFDDKLSVGALTSFILYAAYSAISINGLTNFYTELNKGIGSAQRIWEILDRKYAISLDEGVCPIIKPIGNVQFENVSFSFPSRPKTPVLENFNLVLKPGTNTAIVGKSGSGKTTIATLLMRLYDPDQGCIKLDGKKLNELNPAWLRSYIGAVTQEPILFSGTIRENILYGLNPGTDISEEDFQRIVKDTHIDEFVAMLPDGMDTIVGQRGMMLSGGQRQRIAIARALIKDPAVLILDEATSALDSVSEELVQNALEKLTKGRTVLTIAHRLSTIRNANNIVVLDRGTICEQGQYTDLVSKDSGIFKELIKKQTFEVPCMVNKMEEEQSVLG